jgi:MFS family permease
MQSAAQLWLVYRLKGSPELLGLFGFANQIPIFFLAPLGGIVADTRNRHKAVMWTQAAAMALAFGLAALTLSGLIEVWHLIVIAFLVGVVNAFDIPIRQAFLNDMVGKEDLMNAIALNSSIFHGARVVGPAIAGFAIYAIGEGWCFFVNGLSFLAVIGALAMMRIDPRGNQKKSESSLKDLLQGFRYAAGDLPVRSVLMLIGLVSVVGLAYAVLLPIFANNILHGGPRGFGILMSAAGIGALGGALHFAGRPVYTGLARWIAVATAAGGIAEAAFSQSRIFWLSCVLLAIVGFSFTVQMAASNTVIQHRVPDALRGRVMAIYAMMFMGLQPFGALFAGAMAKRVGAPATIGAGGIACVTAAVIFGLLVLWPIERGRREEIVHTEFGQ